MFLGVDNTGSYLEYFPSYMPGVVLTLFVITKMNNKNIDRLDFRKYLTSIISREKGLKDCQKMNNFRIMTPIQRNVVTYQRSKVMQAIIRE